MGHGCTICIADANFPSDAIAQHTTNKVPIRIRGLKTFELLRDILTLFPLDSYSQTPVCVMDRVINDKVAGLTVPTYAATAEVTNMSLSDLTYHERSDFYLVAKECFCIVQTDDRSLYANIIISKGVVP